MKFLSQTEVDQLRHTFNMKFLVILAVAVASAASAEIPYKPYVKSDESSGSILKSFKFANTGPETDDGIYTQSEGVVKNPNSGSHVPVAPPVSELIQRSLQYFADHPEQWAETGR